MNRIFLESWRINNVLTGSAEEKNQLASLRSNLVGKMHEDSGLDSG